MITMHPRITRVFVFAMLAWKNNNRTAAFGKNSDCVKSRSERAMKNFSGRYMVMLGIVKQVVDVSPKQKLLTRNRSLQLQGILRSDWIPMNSVVMSGIS